MDEMRETKEIVLETSRFDDDMVDVSELMRVLARLIVNEVMDAQADEACAKGNRRKGCCKRGIVTCVSEITIKIPKPRIGSYYPEDLLTRWSRTHRAMAATIAEMATNGVSTRRVEKVARAMSIERMSSSQVPRICESFDETAANMQGRHLSEHTIPTCGPTSPTSDAARAAT